MRYKFQLLSFLIFVTMAAVIYFSHSLADLELTEIAPEKVKVKISSEVKMTPPPPVKKLRSIDQFKPISQKFEIQQLSSQIYGSGQSGKGFSSGDRVLNSLNSAQELTQGPSPKVPIQIKYPDFAKQKSLKGFVEIAAVINTSGFVEHIEIIKSQPPGVFDDYVKNEIRKIQFQPGLEKGKVVSQQWVQKVRFEYE
jgi:TonB family protein